jgi:hypothetical protein
MLCFQRKLSYASVDLNYNVTEIALENVFVKNTRCKFACAVCQYWFKFACL